MTLKPPAALVTSSSPLSQLPFSPNSFLLWGNCHSSSSCGAPMFWLNWMWSHSDGCSSPWSWNFPEWRKRRTHLLCWWVPIRVLSMGLLDPVCHWKHRVVIKQGSYVISISSRFQLNSSWICLTSGLWNGTRYEMRTSPDASVKFLSFSSSVTSPAKCSCCFFLSAFALALTPYLLSLLLMKCLYRKKLRTISWKLWPFFLHHCQSFWLSFCMDQSLSVCQTTGFETQTNR